MATRDGRGGHAQTRADATMAAVIFDLDGLLADTEGLRLAAVARVLHDLRGVVLPRDAAAALVGLRTDEIWTQLRARYALTANVEELEAEHAAVYDPVLRSQVAAMPGAREIVAALRARSLPLAVATASPRRQVLAVLERLGLHAMIGVVAAGDEVARGKPAPDVYLLACARLGAKPARCVAVEDSGPGVAAAVAAGLHVVVVPSPVTAGQVAAAGATLVLPSLVGAEAPIIDLLRQPSSLSERTHFVERGCVRGPCR